ncbi:MAG TPA: ATP-binding cassette domain-containing protein, partial [Oligoflexia bacterium]|nr:ATP-binding cassette domain-containing protein [Oligoflexia bacterium]
MEETNILSVSGLSKSYQSGDDTISVLNNISFSLTKGESAALVGPSGSGKTTLLSLCAGLERPNAGSVVVCGRRLDILAEDALARFRSACVGFVFQTFQLVPTLTALENVML